MDFRTYLCESLNTEVSDIEILEDEKEIFRVRFKIGAESPYLVVFIFNKKRRSWEIVFGLEKELGDTNYSKRWATKFTQEANPLVVFKGVSEAIKMFIKNKKNKKDVCLYFRTKDEKRKNIFEKILNKMKNSKIASEFSFNIVDENGVNVFNICKDKKD